MCGLCVTPCCSFLVLSGEAICWELGWQRVGIVLKFHLGSTSQTLSEQICLFAFSGGYLLQFSGSGGWCALGKTH